MRKRLEICQKPLDQYLRDMIMVLVMDMIKVLVNMLVMIMIVVMNIMDVLSEEKIIAVNTHFW